MIKEITLGQYYPANSIIHRLDPRLKIIGTLCFFCSQFLYSDVKGYLVITLSLIIVIKLSTIPFIYIIRGLKIIIIILMVSVTFNIFMRDGYILVQFWIFKVTKEGIYSAVFSGTRLINLIIGTSIMTLTSTPTDLTNGLEHLLNPLKKIGVSVNEISTMIAIVLRFIPILLEELNKIIKAQTARGGDFDSGNLILRIKGMLPLMLPLFVSAFRRSNDLAISMESRCYRMGEGRTKMKPLCFKKEDYIAFSCIVVYFIIILI